MIPKFPKGFSHPMRIGDGAFASVYRVRQNALDRWAAVKVLDERDPARKREIIKEATTQARITSTCIPQVYHAFEWRGRIWIVMEWIRGVSLSVILARQPSEKERLWLADGCIKSLACLHGLGFAHRDLKPANIIISPDKGAMLVDFGFAKNIRDMHESVAGVVRGTPAYMAPELWTGKKGVDTMRCDVFALGRILRDILRGEPYEALSAQCSHEIAAQRPPSAQAVLDIWEKTSPLSAPADWQGLSRAPTSHHLSEKLANAARMLLSRGRQDEAYWLLVESIEENPANTEAVLLMNSFPKYVAAKKKQRRMTYAVSTAVCACLILIAFAVGWNSRGWNGDAVADASKLRDAKDRSVLIARALHGREPAADQSAELAILREDITGTSRLQGTVYIAAQPLAGTLTVDGVPVERKNGMPSGVMLPYGRHVIAWADENGKTLFRDRINLLPFETRIVSMAAIRRK